MNKKIFKRAVAMLMAAVLTVGAALPSSSVFASGSDGEGENAKKLAVYDPDIRTDLEKEEVAVAEDIVIAAGYGFDIAKDLEGITYDADKVAVSYYPDLGSFDGDKPGDYDTYYKAEPVSGREAYLVHRTISVEEIADTQTDNTESVSTEDDPGSDDEEEPEPEGESLKQISRGHPRRKGIANKPPI